MDFSQTIKKEEAEQLQPVRTEEKIEERYLPPLFSTPVDGIASENKWWKPEN